MSGFDAKRLLRSKDAGITLSALTLFLFFSLTSESFLTRYNLFNVSRMVGFFALVALSQGLALVVGGMNLSVGAIGGLATVTVGYLIANLGLPGGAAVIAAVAVLVGALNGLVITRLKINSFITTLATLFIFTGIVLGFSEGYAYTKIPKSFTLVGRGGLLFLSNLFWIALATLAATHCLFSYTVFGRHLLATGSNPEAARLSGISTRSMIVAANVLSGFYAALAAVLWVSRMGSAQPATGKDWLISSFAIAIVGGTGLSGGSISSLGILMGAIIIVLIKNGLVMLDANVYFEQSFLGSIILAAVVLNRARELWTKE
jgi:ribose transport system permease protein